MGIAYLNLKPVVAAIAVVLAFSSVGAGQTADSTNEAELLRQLAQAQPAEAARVDRQLQAIWGHSGSAAMDLLLKRGREALERGDVVAAIEHFTALTDHAPEFAEGWHARASAYFAADLYGPAVADLGRALTLNPNNYNAIFGLGSILETIGDTKKAYDAYARAKSIHPNFDEVSKALERLKPQIAGNTL